MNNAYNDTIAAIATPLGHGGIGVIRISGQKSLKILKNIFPSQEDFQPNFVYHGQIIHPASKKRIDDVCIIYFKSPRSYTGEDVVEIQGHSNVYILQSILSLILERGARLATKGEFTKRAYIQGKMNLTQAEAIIDLIKAKSPKAVSVALGHLQGRQYQILETMRQNLMDILQNIEASIDFPEDVEALNKDKILNRISPIRSKINDILKLQTFGEMLHLGVKCLIVGKPNVGKSLLLNQILGQERAIVTSIPGTTRDFLDGQVEIKGLLFKFIDTAGYRKVTDRIEKIGISKLISLIKDVHIILCVLDVSRNISKEDLEILGKIKNKKNICIILNKIDKQKKSDIKKHQDFLKYPVISVSAKTGQGISSLKNDLYKIFIQKFEKSDLDLICNLRQLQCIKKADKLLRQIMSNIKNIFCDDLILADDLKRTLAVLGEISGEEISHQVLEGIFSRFCIGK